MSAEHRTKTDSEKSSEYEPPRIEAVLTAEELAREAAFAAAPTTIERERSISDRNAKENFAAVDPREVLEKLAVLAVQSWNYKGQSPAIRHIGPMAQDFAAAFGVGESDKYICTVDAIGVVIAGLQALRERLKEKEAQVEILQREVRTVNTVNQALKADLDALKEKLLFLGSEEVRISAAGQEIS